MTKIQTYGWVFLAITICQIIADENPIKTETTVRSIAHKDSTGLSDKSVQKADPKNSAIDSSLPGQVKLMSNRNEHIEDLPIPPLQSDRSNTAKAKNNNKPKKIRATTKKLKVRPTRRRIRPRPVKKQPTVRRNITTKLRIVKKLKPIKTTNLTISTHAPVSETAFDTKRAQTRKPSHYKRTGVFGRRDKKENTLTASKNATNVAQ